MLTQKLKVFSKKRNATSYDSAGNVSDQELQEVIRIATSLHQDVIAWLHKNHPSLLQKK